MKLVELMKDVDTFVEKYGDSQRPDLRAKMKAELLELVQGAVDLGEGKDQNKITGIATGIIKNFFGKKD